MYRRMTLPTILDRSTEKHGNWWVVEAMPHTSEVRLVCYAEAKIEVFQRWPSLNSAQHAGRSWLDAKKDEEE